MTIPNKTFLDGMHVHQRDVFEAFDKGEARQFWLEWARRHRKTTLAVNLLVREACTYPQAKYVYVSPFQTETRSIVWDDPTMLKNALPDKSEMDWKDNDTKMLVTFANGSMVKFGGADQPDSLRGIDSVGVVFDERALQKEEVWTEIFRPIMAGPLPPHLQDTDAFRWAMFLYTPKGINHATIGFDKACCLESGGTLPDCGKAPMMRDGHYASRIDAEKFDIISSIELAQMREDMPKVLYDQEMRCCRTTQEERTLITSAMLHALLGINWEMERATHLETRRIVAIDPAFGGDMCDIKGMDNYRILAHKKYHPHMTNEIVLEGKRMAVEIGTKNFIVDCIGYGKGVADSLQNDAADYHVQMFNSSESPTDKPAKKSGKKSLFHNKKAQAYFYAAELVRKLKTEAITDRELLRQLPMASRYNVTGRGQLIMLGKDIIKKDLGCSPDDADSYVIGLWGLQNVDPITSEQEYEERPSSGVYVPNFIGV